MCEAKNNETFIDKQNIGSPFQQESTTCNCTELRCKIGCPCETSDDCGTRVDCFGGTCKEPARQILKYLYMTFGIFVAAIIVCSLCAGIFSRFINI